MRKYLVIVIALITVLSGCSRYRDIQVSNINLQKFKLASASKIILDLNIDVDNPTKASFKLAEINGVVYKDGAPFANISLVEEQELPAKFTGVIPITCRVDLLDPMSILVMGLNINSWNPDELTLRLKATVRKGMLKKTIKLNDISLEKLIRKFKM